jgi:hypothetical protein
MEHEDGRSFVWFISQHDGPLTAEPVLAGGGSLRNLDGAALHSVELPPFGVVVAEMAP